ncbi:MAG: hypothetical protein KJ798_06845 [Gammaproteobacteria bacterium]|nr:hypothetical protein [Gammaproteobacteria bacterium]MBU0847875.1 hypothetical protein [Gammaproteobacteria bacterium]MBU1269005.1 hypothetical protein [Gammaproteobacteria bacterium]MBU1529661.1 hypothetical protein [Gammaproteobacteria bacterium]MBU1780088.1 hypothetical protein [Gammaproteobacteria bacterium]
MGFNDYTLIVGVAFLVAGFLAGATGVSSVPSAPYMNSLGMSKDELLQALGLVPTMAGVLVLGGYMIARVLWL